MESTPVKNKARALNRQAREIVYNVHKFLSDNKISLNIQNTGKSTAEATGVSLTTVKRIVHEGKSSLASGASKPLFSTPKKKHGGENKIQLDNFGEGVLRRKIHEFYVEKKECPTVDKLLNSLKNDSVINCSREVLRKKIHEIGFKWKKCQSNRQLLIEKSEIVAWRGRYLQTIAKLRQANRPIVYLDETYVHSTHTTQKCWQSKEEMGVCIPTSKGRKLIVVHGGGEMGFIDNALLIFKSDSKTGDYHGDMNGEIFTKWLQERLVPNLPTQSVLVMDNASYHCIENNKKPNSASLKATMQEWLHEKGIHFSREMTKANLMEIIKCIPAQKNYVLDTMLERYGHTVLRLPPYHPELNPIELVWAFVKGKVGRECLSSGIDEKRHFLEECFSGYSTEMWQNCCNKVKKIEAEYMKSDGILDNEIDKIIVNIGYTSTDESDDE
jgi:transposase